MTSEYWGPERATYEEELTAFVYGRAMGPYLAPDALEQPQTPETDNLDPESSLMTYGPSRPVHRPCGGRMYTSTSIQRIDIDPAEAAVQHAVLTVRVKSDGMPEWDARQAAIFRARDELAFHGYRTSDVRTIVLRAFPEDYLFEVGLYYLSRNDTEDNWD